MSITLVLVRLNFGLNSTILRGRKLLGGRALTPAMMMRLLRLTNLT